MAQSSTKAAKRRGPGRPFAKGVSGNPGGKPKGVAVAIDAALKLHGFKGTEPLIAELVTVFSTGGRRGWEAHQLLIQYRYGKPPQTVEHTGEGGGPIRVTWGEDA